MKIYTLAELEKLNYIELGRGNIISKNEIKDNPGNYPVYSSSKLNEGKMGEYNKFMFDEELITWSVDGGGYLFYRSHHKFSITNVTGYLRIIKKDLIDYKYLYYVLVFLHSKIKFDWVKKAHPSILRKKYKNIPLPTIKKQKDLIKIINSNQNIAKDSINKIENNLSNINNLLDKYLGDIFKNFPKETIHKSLKEISNEYGRGKSKHRPRNDKKLFGEKYPFVQTGDVRNASKYINRFSKSYNDVGLKQSKLWKKGTVCITIAANIAEVGILNFDACFPDSVIGIYPNKKYTNSEYIFYLLSR